MKEILNKGIDSFELKILGLILMTFDHLGAFLACDVPVWFGWLGRPVAVMFLFTSAQGYRYTKDKKKYLSKLLIGFWVMNVGNIFFEKCLHVEGIELYANIFGALFLSVLYMYLFDLLKASIQNKNIFKIIRNSIFMLLPFAMGYAVVFSFNISLNLARVLLAVCPTPLTSEGGIAYILVALLFHIFKGKRKLQLLVVAIFGTYAFVTSLAMGQIFTINYAWMVIFAVIPLALYNGKKGKSMKYLFYAYYPIHIFVIYTISYFIQRA